MLGRHPADAAGAAWEARRVAELRGRAVPWAHIANQLGKCETSLRGIYDADFGGARERRAAEKSWPEAGTAQARTLLAIGAGKELTREIAVAARRPLKTVIGAMVLLKDRGLVVGVSSGHIAKLWRLTDAGRHELPRLRGR